MKNLQKGSTAIVLLVIILLGVIGWMYIKQPTRTNIQSIDNQETRGTTLPLLSQSDNLLTYTNSQFGYTLKYPSGWKIEDLSYTYQNNNSINFRIFSPARTDISESNGQSVTFDMLVCKINGIFTNRCYQNYGEVVSFVLPYKAGNQAVNSLNLSSDFIKNTPEYKTAVQILSSVKSI